ncbi:hypothetical protein BOTBODRAFT_63273 [Botryobasidium botryosum FD-172 SS1]|uniref:mRNA decay factor PAT1 domain-containing protein n=1 Tax=Botryobasidium botryosum (strain FD-172 SS1) TaxID=930990 RepID=A0A067N5V2_BOTB1|nr:hypothetical protein BOTBODRAFT_63273 [Botryobasidium botryosum FD-172 SS1]
MSFFGFDTTLDRDKRNPGEGNHENIAVYTFGEDGYDALGDALDEGLDELNDETFGGSGDIGKDFDYAGQTGTAMEKLHVAAPEYPQPPIQVKLDHPSSLEALWAQASPQPNHKQHRVPSAGRHVEDSWGRADTSPMVAPAPVPNHAHKFDPFSSDAANFGQGYSPVLSPRPPVHHAQPRIRTLQEIEMEQLALAQQARLSSSVPSLSNSMSHLSMGGSESPSFGRYHHEPEYTRSPSMANQQYVPDELEQQLLLQAQQQQLLQLQQHLLQQRHVQQQQQLLQQQQQQLTAQAVAAAYFGGAPAKAILSHPDLMEHSLSMDPEQREAVMTEAMRKIMEAERMEEKRRRKAFKIAQMSKYNDIMTQSDKDFITRIQVSQLVTQDPYSEDFYAQVFSALRSRGDTGGVIKFGSSGGIGVGVLGHRGPGRRENAMQKMQAQVERIVNAAKNREKEKGNSAALQGALGRVSGRSYKAAPRQLLQVEPGSSPVLAHATANTKEDNKAHEAREGVARAAAQAEREALTGDPSAGEVVRQPPLTHRQVLVAIEALYDVMLKIEQLRRDQPEDEESQLFQRWNAAHEELIEKLWVDFKVMVPLETSDPHPFISLIAPIKGKRLLPRLLQAVSQPRRNLFFTLLVACFSQLDVVRDAPLLDIVEDTREKRDVEKQTEAFLVSVFPTVLGLVKHAPLRLISGMLGLLFDGGDLLNIARTKPGLALLTILLSRVVVLKEGSSNETEPPTPEELQQWQSIFEHLFLLLSNHLLSLFPSTRVTTSLPFGPGYYVQPPKGLDFADQPVWQFLAALALNASMTQQQALVTELREKVLENVTSANKGWTADETERQAKIANVNLFLHALGLDSSQIVL